MRSRPSAGRFFTCTPIDCNYFSVCYMILQNVRVLRSRA